MTLRTWIWLVLTVLFLGVAAYEAVVLWGIIGNQHAIGVDFEFYRSMGERWLGDRSFYTERQLAGPYETTTLIDNLYPPAAVLWFVPLVILPPILWWLIPGATIAYVVWRLRPQPWAYAVMAAILAAPKTPTAIIYGNSDMWVAGVLAAGVLWGWPAILIGMKPSFAPLALIGLRRRGFWFAASGLAVANLPLLDLWLQYPQVMLNSSSTPTYSLFALPMVILPLVAWLGSSRRTRLGGPPDRPDRSTNTLGLPTGAASPNVFAR